MALSTIGKCILVPLNTLFMLLGLGLTAVGAIMTFFPGLFLNKLFDIVRDSLKSVLNNNMVVLPGNAKDLKDVPFFDQLGMALLVAGIVLFFISWMGWCGACCPSCCKCLLLVFAAVILVVMAAEVVVGTMFLVTDSPLHREIRSDLRSKMKGFNETSGDDFSVLIVFINDLFDCCGIEGKEKDFGNLTVYSCHNNTVGCYDKLIDELNHNMIWVGFALAGILALQLLEVIFSIAIFKGSSKISPI